MLTIAKQQMEALETAALRAFEDRTLAHLQRYFPAHCALLGETQMRVVIRLGLARASAHGLTPECCVRGYIDLMCVLGSGFDQDPLLPWAAATLAGDEKMHEVERGDLLYDRAWAYIRAIMADYRDANGAPTTERFVPHLRQLRQVPLEPLTPGNMPRFSTGLLDWIEEVFPAKCAIVGLEPLGGLVPRAIATAGEHGIRSERGVALTAVCLFVLGAGFADDPLLPWAQRTLMDPDLPDEHARVNGLYAEAVGFLNRWWALDPTRGV